MRVVDHTTAHAQNAISMHIAKATHTPMCGCDMYDNMTVYFVHPNAISPICMETAAVAHGHSISTMDSQLYAHVESLLYLDIPYNKKLRRGQLGKLKFANTATANRQI